MYRWEVLQHQIYRKGRNLPQCAYKRFYNIKPIERRGIFLNVHIWEVSQHQIYRKGKNLPHCFAIAAIYEPWLLTCLCKINLAYLCICILIFQISLGSKWICETIFFRICEIAKIKGDKVNEWHYWGQSSNHILVFPLILFCNHCNLIMEICWEEKRGLLSLYQCNNSLQALIKEQCYLDYAKGWAGLSQTISYEIICRNRRGWFQEVWKPFMDYINKAQAVP